MVEFEIEGDRFNQVFLVAPQLMVPMILGADFLNENKVVLNVAERSLQAERDGVVVRYKSNKGAGQDIARCNGRDPKDDGHYNEAYVNHTLVLDSGSQSQLQVDQPAAIRDCNHSQEGTEIGEEIEGEPPGVHVICSCCNRDCSYDCSERKIEINECGQVDPAKLEYGRRIDIDKGERQCNTNNSNTRAAPAERRNISSEGMSGIIEAQGNLSRLQKGQLSNVLVKYLNHFTFLGELCRRLTNLLEELLRSSREFGYCITEIN
ncbi:hypothetical protein L798_06484 [Zootermopsis nevadensis]|uniref:Uncharacterized protein n=1 Tax=Zootermopsis nevadensis TaxID=136037 RepID=A0A067QS30_ZOONE|nr:hypothetical protein L798_06484 [Zootermopsis nevadensis]